MVKELGRAFQLELGSAPSVPSLAEGSWAHLNVQAPQAQAPVLPIPADLYARCQAMATKPPSAYPRKVERLVRVPDAQYEALLRTPALSPETWD